MRSWHHLWRSYGGPLPVKKKHESYFCGSWQVVALKSCGVAKDLKKCFCLLFLPQSWLEHGGPLFFRLNHERVDFVPSSLEAIDKTPQPKSGCIAQNKANLVSTFEKKHVIIPCICGKSMKKLYIYICISSWVVPLPSNSRHQDCYIFATLIYWEGGQPYMCASDTLAFPYSPQYIYQTPAYQENSPSPKTHSPSQNLKSQSQS